MGRGVSLKTRGQRSWWEGGKISLAERRRGLWATGKGAFAIAAWLRDLQASELLPTQASGLLNDLYT